MPLTLPESLSECFFYLPLYIYIIQIFFFKVIFLNIYIYEYIFKLFLIKRAPCFLALLKTKGFIEPQTLRGIFLGFRVQGGYHVLNQSPSAISLATFADRQAEGWADGWILSLRQVVAFAPVKVIKCAIGAIKVINAPQAQL